MKNTILSILLLIIILPIAEAQNNITSNLTNSNLAIFEFETEEIDYGTIEYNSDGKREFKFKNIGNVPIIIVTANSSCGCLVPEWPKEPILPGASGIIKSTYHTKRVGPFHKTITIYSNADRPQIVLKIKGIVKSPPVIENKVFPVENRKGPLENK